MKPCKTRMNLFCRLARAAAAQYDIKNVVVTRSEKGMTLAGQDGLIINAPATALDVFDVSGAGDIGCGNAFSRCSWRA